MSKAKEIFIVEPATRLGCDSEICDTESAAWQAMQNNFEAILDDHSFDDGDSGITIKARRRWTTMEAWKRFKKDTEHDTEAGFEGPICKTQAEVFNSPTPEGQRR